MTMSSSMKSKLYIALIALVVVVVVVLSVTLGGISENYAEKYEGVDLSADVGDIVRTNTYKGYLDGHQTTQHPAVGVEIDLLSPTTMTGATISDYQGRDNCLLTEENSYVEWIIEVPEAGMYNILFEYCPMESRGIDAERKLYINGSVPFRGADCLTFTRLWTTDGEVKTDNRGNEIRPMQCEVYNWTTHFAQDDYNGYQQDPYLFYLEKGANTIAVEGVTEPVAFSSIWIVPKVESVTYEEYLKINNAECEQSDPWSVRIQGETAVLKSDSSLYATYDRSAPNTDPYSIKLTKLNMIGGGSWALPGQWIEWEFEVPEDGWYYVAIKGRQNYARGQTAIRQVYVDGEIPYEEVSTISFSYSNDWEIKPLGDSDEYGLYLTKGTHKVRLEVVLGEMGDVLYEMEDCLFRLNQLYRKLLVVMGNNPDRYRDYQLDQQYPELAEAFRLESCRLYKIVDDINRISGGRSSNSGSILTLAKLTEEFSEDTDIIKRRLATFRDNISSMGTVMQNLAQSQLDIDYLVVKNAEEQWPKDKANFFTKLWHELRSFFASFTTDYTSLGDVHEGDDVIEVWILSGRDQANILKTIIDDSFTPNTGIAVNLKLVEAGTVMPAVVAGDGPDVVLSAQQGEPVNYILRGAAEDLRQFEDCDEVLSRFSNSAWLPYVYGDAIAGLPETQQFNVLFYRTDILEELGLEPPETWEDLTNMLPTLQEANMDVGLPDVLSKNASDLSGFYAMMYQNGCELYSESGDRALLDAEGAIQAFDSYAKFYTNHEQPSEYNFANRFRSGEMPIGIANYTMANTLAVFAPELKGLWSFALMPGTVQEDGMVDHSVYSWGTSCMMMQSDDEALKAKCWEFLKWWTSTETQARFGRELECIMGASARYPTANVEAFERLAWSATEMKLLEEQRKYAKTNREIPGGYYTSRHILNAIRRVVNDQELARETLLDYNQTINEEIERKRAEFGLD